MYFELFQQNLPDYFKPREFTEIKGNTIQYGFTADIDFGYHDDYGSKVNKRKNAMISNKMTFLGLLEGKAYSDVSIYDGYRNDVFTTEGMLDKDMTSQLVSKFVPRRRDFVDNSFIVATRLENKNCVSVLYNMLRLYYIKCNSGMRYDPDDLYYDNGHVAIRNGDMFKGQCTTLEKAVDMMPVRITPISEDVIDSNANVVITWRGKVTAKDVAVLGCSFAEWTSSAPFLLAHSSPQLADEVVVNADIDNSCDVDYSSVDVLSTIRNFVISNKLYADFDIAYGMLVQCITLPSPRVAESAQWFSNVQTVMMPNVMIYTGLFPQIVSMLPYFKEDSWKVTFTSWQTTPTAVYYHSMSLAEDVFLSMSDIARQGSKNNYDLEELKGLSIAGGAIASTGLLTDLLFIAMRRGTEIKVVHPLGAGITRDPKPLQTRTVEVKVVLKDEEAAKHYNLMGIEYHDDAHFTTAKLVIRSVTPALYPVLTYGLYEDDLYADYISGEMKLELQVNADGNFTFSDPIEFSKFMNIARMMGNDVKAVERFSGRTITNFADNGVGRFIYTDLQLNGNVLFDVNAEQIVPRRHHWLGLTGMVGLCSLKYQLSNLRACIKMGNEFVTPRGRQIVTQADKLSDKVRNYLNMNEQVLITPLNKVVRQDFRFVEYQIPGTREENIRMSLQQRIINLDPGNEEPVTQEELPEEID